MEFLNKTFLVVGTGLSGIAAAKLLAKKGAKIIFFDGNTDLREEKIREKLPEGFAFRLVLGDVPGEVIGQIDTAVLSPGVPLDAPVVRSLKEKGIPIIGEIELAYLCGKGQVFAITGTNGKTTTTALCGAIMRTYFDPVFVVGNIGTPYTEYAAQMGEDAVTVAEISSFQLETVDTFHPQISAILNITPDHLNRHHTMECYAKTKALIAKNQTKKEVCVLNYEDSFLRQLAKDIPADIFWFSSKRKLERGIYLSGEEIRFADKTVVSVCNIHEMKLLGMHNVENVMAAAAIALKAGVPLDCVRAAIRDFDAVEHRIEYVDEIDGVKYYNDSKGTNTDASIKAIEAMERPTVLIGGGYDKESDYDDWIQAFGDKVKCLVLIGQTKEKIAEAAKKADFTDVVLTDSLEEAVNVSRKKAVPGDAVLLSPACASWDMFKNYEERGNLFKEVVKSFGR